MKLRDTIQFEDSNEGTIFTLVAVSDDRVVFLSNKFERLADAVKVKDINNITDEEIDLAMRDNDDTNYGS